MNVKLFVSGHTFLDNPHRILQIQKVNPCQYSFPYMFHAAPVVRVECKTNNTLFSEKW